MNNDTPVTVTPLQEVTVTNILDSNPDAVFIIDINGQIVDCNTASLEIFHYSSKTHLRETSIDDLFTNELRTEVPTILKQIDTNGPFKNRKCTCLNQNHIRFHAKISGNVLTKKRQGTLLYILTIHETSSENEEKEATVRAKLAMENVEDAIFLIEGGTLKCVYLNTEAKNITGYTDQDIGKITCMDTMPQVSLPNFADKIEPILNGEKSGVTFETTYHRTNGTQLPVEIKFHRMEELGGKDYFISIARDISERKKAKHELERSNRELVNFAYAASHDLKAPLRAISQLASWIQEDITDNISNDTKRNLELLGSRVKRMDDLLNGLLAYSRVGRIEGDLSIIHTKELINDILFLLNAPQEFSITISNIIPEFKTLKVPLEQVLRNLIGNAIKYHHKKDGKIEISMREKNDLYEFSVIDDGPGIAPEYHDKIFEMFKRLVSRDEIEGSGMGLALVKKTIENYNGTISVESDVGKGAHFKFSWPKNISGEKQ